MKVMGLDVSTDTGLAVLDHEGTVLLARNISYPKLRGMERIHHLVSDIIAVRDTHSPELIVIEDYATGAMKGAGAFVTPEIQGVLRFLLWQDGIKPAFIPPSMLKKFLTGKGNAKKEHMLMEVYKRWSYSSATNDIADAVALAHLGLAMRGQGVNCSKAMLISAQEACKLNSMEFLKS